MELITVIGVIIGILIGLIIGSVAVWFVQEFRGRSRMASQPADHQAAIAALKSEHDQAVADMQVNHLKETTALNAEHQTAVANLKSEHDQVVANMQVDHLKETAALNAGHQSAISTLKSESDQSIADLRAKHQEELARLNELIATQPLEHEAAVIKLRAEHDEKVAELQAGHQKELAGLNEKVADLNGQMEQVASAQQMLETAKAQFSETAKLMATDALKSNNQQFLELAKENFGNTLESAQRELDQRHQQFQELVKPLSDQYSQITDTFQNTATSALQNNSKQFLELAQENWNKTLESAKSEFHQRHQQFQELVKPLSENYGKLNPQIEQLSGQVRSITSETARLSTALRGDNRAVGNWGEMQLRRVVEIAGMTAYCEFEEQARQSEGRPDMVVKLPERRAVVVDAKASTAAFLEVSEAADDDAAQSAFTRHANALRAQIDDLSRKNYGNTVDGSLDFVVMFIPGDQFLAAALRANRGLIEYAMNRRVAIATPASLIAMLWAISSGWQQFRLAEDAAKVKEVGEEMHKRMLTFINRYQNVGKQLDQAVAAYNDSIGSFDRRVVPQGRRFASLVVGDEDDFPALNTSNETVRASAYATDLAVDDDATSQAA